MPEPSVDPEKYSIEEMMERLKRRGDDAKELVTREDGSQVMKMRKRKRRTNQAVNQETKRNQRVYMIQIAGFVFIAALLFLVGIIGVVYSNSVSFRKGLVEKAEATSGAKVDMKQFRMNPVTANSSRVSMSWPEGNVLSWFEVTSPEAKIAPASFIGNVFSGEEIVALKGDLVLRAPVQGEEVVFFKSSKAKPIFVFNRYSLPSLNIYFGGEKLPTNMLEKTEASYFPISGKKRGEIRLNGGLFKFGDWPHLNLERSYIKHTGSELDIKSMKFTIPIGTKQRGVDLGSIDFSGVIQPLQANTTHELAVSIETFRLSYLLGSDLGRLFLGSVMTKEVSGSNFFRFSPDSVEEALLELSLVHALDSRVDISQFDFLNYLALLLDERWYELPYFENDVSFLLRRQGDLVEIKNILLEQKGRMAIRGNLTTKEGGIIAGALNVGIPGNLISGSKNIKLDRVFGPLEDGYRWVKIEVGGTGAAPIDNFRQLYKGTNEDAVIEETKEDKDKPDSFDSLIEGD